MKRFTELADLVDDLLARIESRADARRLLGYPGKFPSVAKEDAFLAGLRSLEATGALVVKRSRIDGVETILHVAIGDLDKLYAFRNRTPASAASKSALQPLRGLPGVPPTTAAVLDTIEASWSRNVAWAGLRPGETDVLSSALKLAVALARLRQPGSGAVSLDYRTFSRRVTGDSKILERRTRLVVELLDRLFFADEGTESGLEDVDLLASLGVVRFAQPLLLGGAIAMDGVVLPRATFHGFPADEVHRLSIKRATHVLLVENYTSFVRHCREVNAIGDGLVIYTGGFPARAVLAAILRLLGTLQCPVYHWGDLDLGGLRIFAHLEQAIAFLGIGLSPHLMSAEVLERHGNPSERRVPPIPGKLSGTAIAPLWSFMSAMPLPMELEQEELDPVRPDING